MGVTLDQWRCAIGVYNRGPVTSSLGTYCVKCSVPWPQTCHLLAVLTVLLLIGGVELNPGPQDAAQERLLCCRSCAFTTASAASYSQHQRIHSLGKRFQYVCPLCNSSAATARSLESHLSRDHPRGTVQPTCTATIATTLNCNVCEQSFSSVSNVVDHLKSHLKEGNVIKCPLGSCSRLDVPARWVVEFHKEANFRVHLSRYHRTMGSSNNPPNLPSASHQEPPPTDFDEPPPPTDQEPSPPPLQIEEPPCDEELFSVEQVCRYIAQFYLKMEGDLNVPSSTIQVMADNLSNIVQFSHQVLKAQLAQELKTVPGLETEVDKILNRSFANDPLLQVHSFNHPSVCLLTEHRRYNYYKKHFNFTEPTTKATSVSFCQSARQEESNSEDVDDPVEAEDERTTQQLPSKEKTIALVDIETSLGIQLADPDVQKEVDLSLQKLSSGYYATARGVYSDFTDGEVFRNHPASKQPCLFLNFSCDAFGVDSALGAAKNKHKTVGIYYVLGNLPPEKRSKVDVLQLAELFLEERLKVSSKGKAGVREKKERWDECLRPVVEQMQQLFQEGIEYKGRRLPVYCLFMFGDNLGQHQIGGFSEVFGKSGFWCRFCELSDAEFRMDPHCLKPLRTQQDYQDCALKVPTLKNNSVTYKGIKFDSVLNALPEFHVCQPGLSPCIAHDIAEGFGAHDMMLFIKYFISKKWFTRLELNARIKNFKLIGKDAADSPPVINLNSKKQMKKKLSGSAAQNLSMIRYFSLILGDKIKSPDDPVWRMYLQLKSICEYLNAPQIDEKGLRELEALIHEYIENRRTLFTQPLQPKHHFLVHYPNLIRLLGPLVRHSTLRMESHHQVMKRAASAGKNFINVPFTMAHKSQLKKAYLSLGSLFGDKFTYTKPRNFVPNWSTMVQQYINGLLSDVSNAACVNTVVIHGTSYQRGMWLLLQQQGENLEVGKILAIYCADDVLFVVEKHSTSYEADGFGLHKIEESTGELGHLSSQHVISSYCPLNGYMFQENLCLSFKHRPMASGTSQ